MIALKIELSGIPEAVNALGESPKVLSKAYRNAVNEIGRMIRNEVKAAAPELTSALKKSIKFKSNRSSKGVISGSVYSADNTAIWLEYGTTSADPHPFFTDIVKRWNEKIPGIFDEIFARKVEDQLRKALQ